MFASHIAHQFNCPSNLAPVGSGSSKKNGKTGNANHAYKGSNNNKKKV
jgi:hypothetical protein